MEFQRYAQWFGTAGIALAAALIVPNISGQASGQPLTFGYGPPATSYAAEAASYPDAASKPTPHMPDGHPDLNGVWHHYFGQLVSQVGGNSFALSFAPHPSANGAPPPRPTPDPTPEYKPEFVAKVKYLNDNQVKQDLTLHCMPPGVPRIGPPQQIIQTPKQVVFLYADITGNRFRVIPTDGRPHNSDPEQEATYDGDSVAHWDGDTLVVDVVKLSSDTWLADNGFFHTSKLHVVERFHRVGDTIQYSMTAEDPAVMAKPWVLTRTLTLQRDALEEAAPCVDNDNGHYVNSEHHDNTR